MAVATLRPRARGKLRDAATLSAQLGESVAVSGVVGDEAEHPLRPAKLKPANGTHEKEKSSARQEKDAGDVRRQARSASSSLRTVPVKAQKEEAKGAVVSVKSVAAGSDPLAMMSVSSGGDPLSSPLSAGPRAKASSSISSVASSAGSPSRPRRETKTSRLLRNENDDTMALYGESGEREGIHAEWIGSVKEQWLREAHSKGGVIKVTTDFEVLSREGKELRTLSSRLKHIENINTSSKAGGESEGLSQSDYVSKLRELNEEIATSWIENNRVAALKLAIRVASLLMDASVPMFYSTLFVLVSDLMDTMGQLVWERIRNKHEYDESGRQVRRLGKVFTCHDLREEARDVCGNWFYKIGSVSDLIPRLYMEAAIIRCSYYLHDGPPVQSLQRMAGMIGGIGNPLARIHAACFIARRACQLIPANYAATDDASGGASSSALPDLLMRLFLSTLPLYRRVTDPHNPRQMHFLRGLELNQYCELFTPALRWLAHCVVCCGHDSGPALAADFVTGNMDKNVYDPDDGVVGAFISAMLDELPDAVVSARADVILKTIVSASFAEFGHRDGAKRATCLRVLAAKLLRVPPATPKRRRAALVGAWRLLRSFTVLEDFMNAADVWIEYAAHHLTMVELDACFADVAMRFEAASNDDDISARAHASLDSAIFKVMDHDAYTDVAVLLESATFVRLVDCLGPDGKQMLFRRLLGSLQKKKARVRDMLTLNFYLDGAKTVAATVDRLTAEGTRKEVFRTIVDLIQSIDFGRDFETHLNVLVECRKSFPFIEPVQEALVLQAIRLAVLTMKAFKGKTTERSSAFIRSCLAFCQITIPSLQGVVTRLNLLTLSAGAALQNGLVGLAEGLLKSAIVLLTETESTSVEMVPSSTAMGQIAGADDFGVVLAITNMCGLFVVLPGHPEYGALYIIEKLVAAVNQYKWACEYDSKLRSCVAILCLLASLSQERLPYRIRAIDSNDVLYSSEPEYQDEIAALAKKVFATAVICALGDDAKLAATKGRPDEKRSLAHAILSLVSTMASMYHLGQDELLAVEQIYTLAQRLLPSDDPVVRRVRRVVSKYVTPLKK